MTHRGPDGAGYYVDDYASLGHRRLSIIDLQGGTQPIFNEDKSIAVVFNGEIYNFKEIRSRLRKSGHTFATESDTEVLVHLYEELGPDLVKELNGMFAIAIWDSKTQTLFAARDRMGEKPLYYLHEKDGTLCFASELKSILLSAKTTPDISASAIADYLSYGYVPAPFTIYKGIFKLPPAHRLIWKGGEIVVDRYWSSQSAQQVGPIAELDALSEFERLLTESIRLRLRSDVPVGAFLSGGIDSSIVVGIASRLLDRPLQTFVVGFSENDFDESKYARYVADVFSTDHHELLVDQISLDVLPNLVTQFDEPFADPSSLPTYYVTRAASERLKVCMSGDGADEIFGGYDRYHAGRADTLARRVLPPHFRHSTVGRLSRVLPEFLPGAGFIGRLSADGADHYQRQIGIFTDPERAELLRNDVLDSECLHNNLFGSYFSDQRYSDCQARMRADQETYLPEDILVKVDRTSMLNSLEVRAPFLDHNLVEFANGLPMHLKMHGNTGKYLLKQFLRTLLPGSFVSRPKHGFSLPIREWFRGSYADNLRQLLLDRDSEIHAYLNVDPIAKTFDAHQAGWRDRSPQLWALLWLELWLRQNRHAARAAA